MRTLTPGLFLDDELVYDCSHKIDYMAYTASVNATDANVDPVNTSDFDDKDKRNLIFYMDTSSSKFGIWKKY